jgi:hypothetical protein
MRSEGNVPKNGEPVVGLYFTTMLHHTCRFGQGFLSKEKCDNIGASHTLLTWIQLIFNCSLDWNQE